MLCKMWVNLPYSKAEHDACYDVQEKKHKKKSAIWELKDFHSLQNKWLVIRIYFLSVITTKSY